MSVRKTVPTTLSLIALIIGLWYLIPQIQRLLPYEAWSYINARSYSFSRLGELHTIMIKAAAGSIVIAALFHAILRSNVALSFLASFNIPIILGIPLAVLIISPLNGYFFWGIVYVAAIIGVYWTFRKLIRINSPYGQKLFSFLLQLKKGPGYAAHNAAVGFDRYVVFGLSLILVIFCFVLVACFCYYVQANWGWFI